MHFNISEFWDSSLNLMAICWVGDYRQRLTVLDEVNLAINREFAGRDVHLFCSDNPSGASD